MSHWVVAVVYLSAWVLVAVVGRKLYKYYADKHKESILPWFDSNPEKIAYDELLKNDPENEEKLRIALLRRAMVDVRRLWQLKEEKSSIQSLMRAGNISDVVWNSFKKAENDLQEEILDLQFEANVFKEGWSETILSEAAMLVQRENHLRAMEKEAKEAAAKKEKDEREKTEKQMKAQAEVERMIEEENEVKSRKSPTNGTLSKKKQ